MFVDLHESIRSFSDSDLLSNAISIENLIISHKQQHLLLCLTPSDVTKISNAIPLGPVARASISAINRKTNDYRGAMKSAKRIYKVCSDEVIADNFQLDSNGNVNIRLSVIAKERSGFSPKLFIENAENDFRCIIAVYNSYCKIVGYPSDLVKITPLHGGGNSLGAVLKACEPGSAMGLCLCDRDYNPFDSEKMFRPGTTASATYQAAIDINILKDGDYGYSSCDPLFAFNLTTPRTIEGFVGPSLLEYFFDNVDGCKESRKSFLDAYPNMPNLSEVEMAIWFSTNLKDGGVTIDELRKATSSHKPDVEIGDDLLNLASKATFPANCTKWIWTEIQSGRHSKPLLKAFEKDLNSDLYMAAVREIVDKVRDLHAADPRMRFA